MSKNHLNLKSVFSKERTFRPKKKFDPGTGKFDLHKKAQASLRSGLFNIKIFIMYLPFNKLNVRFIMVCAGVRGIFENCCPPWLSFVYFL